MIENVAESFVFQSTLPAGGATRQACQVLTMRMYFNPRSPRGERLEGTEAVLVWA